jgi:iron uptake system EfeUOB component EfeO/EfeM
MLMLPIVLVQMVAEDFSELNATLTPFITLGAGGLVTYTPYSNLTNEQRANISAAVYAMSEHLHMAAEALGAHEVRT